MDLVPIKKILSIARAGNPARAWSLFHSDGWDDRRDDPKALTLKARLLKDQAKAASGAERVRLYGEAADTYVAAAAFGKKSYPLINAATLALLGGKEKQSRALAQEVFDLLDTHPGDAETDYWLDATRAEALLLLGKEAEARAALKLAIVNAPEAWEDHAATIGQFMLIIAEQGGDDQWLDHFRPPCSLHFSGIIGLDENDPKIVQDIAAVIAREKPGFGFGALAAGADIMIAEALHAAGAELHITLPYPVDRFRELSVAPFGEQWLPRFDALLNIAETVHPLVEMAGDDERPLGAAINLGDQMSMGQAIRNAAVLQSSAKALSIMAAGEKVAPQTAVWQAAGHESIIIETSRMSDGKGPSGILHDKQQIASISWVENCANPDTEWTRADGGYYRISEFLMESRAVALSILSEQPDASASLIFDIFDKNNPSTAILSRAKDIAVAADKGCLLVDQKTAMALTLADSDAHIQEIGERVTAYGVIPLWSVF